MFVASLSFGGTDLRDVLIGTAETLVTLELGGTLLRARSEVAGLSVAAEAVWSRHKRRAYSGLQ